jgi:dethiobiotin synthetase
MRAWFVAGTDTGVGKTRVSVALLHALRRGGAAAVGMKPVAAGAEQGVNEDVAALRAASSFAVDPDLDNPYLLQAPVSPHIAAQREDRTISIERIAERFAALQARCDAVVVEGAGGFCVPLSAAHTGADLARALGLPVILVVGLRLGCLNHALLTHEAILGRGLALAGWVANELDPGMPERGANIEFLRGRLGAPLLAHWPWQPDAPAALAIEVPHA